MSKSVKLPNNAYIDSSGIVYNHETLNSILDKRIAKYTLSNTIGWKRIASFTGMAGGMIIIESDPSYGTVAKIDFASATGWSSYFSKIFKKVTNGDYFTKARIVRKGNATSYLELYQALELERSMYINALSTINVVLNNSETQGNIPDGYSADEYNFV